ncbi:MAG: hypothetical protein LBT83_10590 [Tannerella sp.]|nr:hypothetical protein [Tannerella sp.]
MAYLSDKDVAERLGLTELQRNELSAAVTAVNQANAKAEEKETRSKLDVFNRREAIREAHVVFRRVINICVANNPDAIPEDYEALSVPRPGYKTPLPVPAKAPGVSLDSGMIRRTTVVFYDADGNKRGKPHGVSGAVVRWAIRDTPPTDINELIHAALDSASPFHIDFTEEQRGKRVYLCLAWQNPKGKNGPWSEILSTLIQ